MLWLLVVLLGSVPAWGAAADGDAGGNVTSAVVGPPGGTVALTDGARVEIPPGALDREVTVTIRVIPLPANAVLFCTSVVVSRVYSFEPEGLGFLKPVGIVIPYDVDLFPPDVEEGDAIIYEIPPHGRANMVGSAFNVTVGEDGELEPIHESHGQGIDIDKNEVDTGIFRFSVYVAVTTRILDLFEEVPLETTEAEVRVFRPRMENPGTTGPDSRPCHLGAFERRP